MSIVELLLGLYCEELYGILMVDHGGEGALLILFDPKTLLCVVIHDLCNGQLVYNEEDAENAKKNYDTTEGLNSLEVNVLHEDGNNLILSYLSVHWGFQKHETSLLIFIQLLLI